MSEVTDGGTFENGESPQEREFCPNLTSPNDLVNRIGSLSVDILNKEKVLAELWMNIDKQTSKVASLNEEIKVLKGAILTDKDILVSKDKQIENLLSDKERVQENQQSAKNHSKEGLQKLKEEHRRHIDKKSEIIQKLEKVVKSIEAEAVVNQEEVRRELMETQNELFSLQESLKSPRKVTKKKKTNAKPARA